MTQLTARNGVPSVKLRWSESSLQQKLKLDKLLMEIIITTNQVYDLDASHVFYCGSVETAGGGGLQLFVDAGVPVDSELIRQYVNEVLAEIITLMLGQREDPREPAATASTQDAHTQQVGDGTSLCSLFFDYC